MMDTNKMLTYLLYALLAGFIAIAGYKTWQIKQEKENMAKANEEFQQSIRDLGFTENDTTESRFEGDENTGAMPISGSSTVIADDGIEDEVPVTTPKKTTPATEKKSAGKPAPAVSAPKAQTTDPASQAQPQNLDNENSNGRYRVVAGSFTKLDGARREMERIIKMGYHDAEIGYFNRGKFATVVVARTDNYSDAQRITEALRKKGVDVRVVDRK